MQPILHNIPRGVLWVLYVIIIMFIVQNAVPESVSAQIIQSMAFVPSRYALNGELSMNIVATIISPVAYSMLHSNLNHIISNLIFFIPFGVVISRQYGSPTFLIIFFGSVIVGALGYYILNPTSLTYLLGASGGVAGLAGFIASISILGKHFPQPFDSQKNTTIFITFWIIFNVIFPFFFEQKISWEAHLAGFIFGFLIAPIYRNK